MVQVVTSGPQFSTEIAESRSAILSHVIIRPGTGLADGAVCLGRSLRFGKSTQRVPNGMPREIGKSLLPKMPVLLRELNLICLDAVLATNHSPTPAC